MQLQDSEMFEDIQLGASRATVVIQRYEELYSQARMEALDAIEGVQIRNGYSKQQPRCGAASTAAMDASDTFNVQLLLEIFKVRILQAHYVCVVEGSKLLTCVIAVELCKHD